MWCAVCSWLFCMDNVGFENAAVETRRTIRIRARKSKGLTSFKIHLTRTEYVSVGSGSGSFCCWCCLSVCLYLSFLLCFQQIASIQPSRDSNYQKWTNSRQYLQKFRQSGSWIITMCVKRICFRFLYSLGIHVSSFTHVIKFLKEITELLNPNTRT